MKVSEAIRNKRAVREFKQEPLPKDVMHAILNAGRRSQSAKNMQRWRFIAVTDRTLLEKLSGLGQWAGHLAGAAMGVFILTTDPNEGYTVMFDAGQSAAYMQLAALELGVGSVLATIYEHERARKLLCFPREWYLNVAISFGYPADETALTRPNKPGGREPLEQVVHWNTWESSPCDE
jgi:nitroreductase